MTACINSKYFRSSSLMSEIFTKIVNVSHAFTYNSAGLLELFGFLFQIDVERFETI